MNESYTIYEKERKEKKNIYRESALNMISRSAPRGAAPSV